MKGKRRGRSNDSESHGSTGSTSPAVSSSFGSVEEEHEQEQQHEHEHELELEQGQEREEYHKRAKLSERRSVLACIRCRRRKTKCSGEYPCQTCIRFNHKCEYPRKPKRIQIYDIEVEQYQHQIQQLKAELEMLKSSSASSHTITITNTNADYDENPEEEPDISIWLGSGSCELICWNLKQFTSKQFNNSQLPVYSPDFNTFIEEKTYNYLFANNSNHHNHSTNQLDNDLQEVLRGITLEKSLTLFDMVISFINIGYLTIINIEQFKVKLNQLFKANEGSLSSTGIISNNKYFILKLLMILSLGEIYDDKLIIHGNKKKYKNSKMKKKEQLPGLKYFKVVLNHLPSPFYYYDDYKSLDHMFEIIELLGLISIYLRIIDKKTLAVTFTLQSLQLCISLNLHKESSLRSFEINYNNHQYLNKLWWSTFCLNRFYSVRISQPLLLNLNDITNNEYKNVNSSVAPTSSHDYANETCMKFYIELAKISDKITNDLYKSHNTMKRNKSQYLHSIISIMEILTNWINNIPSFLRLNLNQPSVNERMISSLHLNYLHHIYLTNIPILLNLVKFKIINYYKHDQIQPPQSFPTNIKFLMQSILNASKLTINIFLSLIYQNKLTTFGMTDLDFLFSCSLVFLIYLILNVDGEKEDLQNYLKISLNIINEMKLNGNLIAKGKLTQIIDLVVSLKKLMLELGYQELIKGMAVFKQDKSDWQPNEEENMNNTTTSISTSSSIFDEQSSSDQTVLTNNVNTNYQYIDNDVLDCTFLSTFPISEDTNNSTITPTPFLYSITDEDINFMEQFFIDF